MLDVFLSYWCILCTWNNKKSYCSIFITKSPHGGIRKFTKIPSLTTFHFAICLHIVSIYSVLYCYSCHLYYQCNSANDFSQWDNFILCLKITCLLPFVVLSLKISSNISWSMSSYISWSHLMCHETCFIFCLAMGLTAIVLGFLRCLTVS